MFADRAPARETVGQRGGVSGQPERIAGTLRNMWPHDPGRTGMAVSSQDQTDDFGVTLNRGHLWPS